MKFYQLILIALLFCTTGVVHAGNDDECQGDPHHCNGGETGPPGADGVDGQDGEDGTDGVDGTNGIDGRDGIDGVVDTTWIIETRNWQSKWYRYSAATEAMQIHLPQDQDQRITFGMSRIHGTTGLGVGYAYKTDRDDNLAFTLGLGTSGGESVGKASVGFEFGGSGGPSHKHQYSCSYVGGELNAEAEESQNCN